jgi:chromosome segregation ATPase
MIQQLLVIVAAGALAVQGGCDGESRRHQKALRILDEYQTALQQHVEKTSQQEGIKPGSPEWNNAVEGLHHVMRRNAVTFRTAYKGDIAVHQIHTWLVEREKSQETQRHENEREIERLSNAREEAQRRVTELAGLRGVRPQDLELLRRQFEELKQTTATKIERLEKDNRSIDQVRQLIATSEKSLFEMLL